MDTLQVRDEQRGTRRYMTENEMEMLCNVSRIRCTAPLKLTMTTSMKQTILCEYVVPYTAVGLQSIHNPIDRWCNEICQVVRYYIVEQCNSQMDSVKNPNVVS